MSKIAVIISPNFGDYAQKYLPECIASLRLQSRTADKIFLVDNESTEASFKLLGELAPEAQVIRNSHNAGFAEGNNVAMRQAIAENFDYIVLVNMDTIIEVNALEEWERVIGNNPRAGAVQARLMLWPDKEKINSLGNATHFMGFGYCEGYGEAVTSSAVPAGRQESRGTSPLKIFYPSGAAVLFRVSTLKKVGLFDETFWMYAEDQDLGWRIWLSGEECILAEKAIVYHKYEFSRSIKKYYWMDRNRFLVLLENFHILTLLFILPAFLVMECGQLYFAVKTGWLKEKLGVYKYFLSQRTWQALLTKRKATQAMRVIKDRQIKEMLVSTIEYQEIASPALKIANLVFSAYWKIIKPLIIW